MPLRFAPTAAPFTVLTAGGSLPSRPSAIAAALANAPTAALVRQRGVLFAADSRDALVLRALGFPATVAEGLGQADTKYLEWLGERFAWPARTTGRRWLWSAGRSGRPGPTPPAALVEAAARLADARRHLGRDLAGRRPGCRRRPSWPACASG